MRALCHRIQTVSIVQLTGVLQSGSGCRLQIPSSKIRGSKSRGFAVKGPGDRGLAEKGLEEILAFAHTHMLTDSTQRGFCDLLDSEQKGLGTSQWEKWG